MAKVKLPVSFRSLDPGDNKSKSYEKEITFYNIDYIYPNGHPDEAKDTVISSGGEEWVCTLPIDEVEKLIDKSK
jgi:hypothetical protein